MMYPRHRAKTRRKAIPVKIDIINDELYKRSAMQTPRIPLQPELTHAFALAVGGPQVEMDADSRPGLLNRAFAHVDDLMKSHQSSTTYIQLINHRGECTSYFFDDGLSRQTKNYQGIAGMSLFCTAVSLAAVCPAEYMLPVTLAGLFAAANVNGVGKGQVFRVPRGVHVASRIVKPVSLRHYERMKAELDGWSRDEKRCGVYSMLFNNCTHFAVRYARANGMDVPPGPLVQTPRRLNRMLRGQRAGRVISAW